jgi:protein-disulfide isomerase
MRLRTVIAWAPLAALCTLAACGGTAEMEEVKKGQKDILAKLESLETSVKQIRSAPAAPGRPQVDPNKVYNIPIGDSGVKGPKDAKVSIVEFSDFQCPFCAQSAGLAKQVLEAFPKDVNLVYKQFPLTSIHPQAMGAAKASLAAGKQGKFWEMHDIMFANMRELQPDKLKEYAGKIGLDVAKFEKDFNSPEIQAQVEREMKEASAAEVTGTPTFFIAGKRVMNRSFEGMKAMIEEALKGKQG